MSSGEGGVSAGVFIGAGVGGAALVVGIIAVVIYCYYKARKEKSNTNMTKSSDHVFTTAASQPDYPMRSRVNQYPDPVAKRNSRRKEREKNHDAGHVNPAYNRHGSETESNSSDMDNRDISPPRVRRARGGHENMAFSSDSSYEDSSSMEEDKVPGSYSVEDETFDKNRRRSFQKATKEQDILDGRRTDRRERSGGRYTRTGDQERRSRRDDFKPRNPRSDSPLTIETLEKHEKITRRESDRKPDTSKKDKSRKREPSPSVDSSATQTGSLVTEGTEFTATTMSSGPRFAKNPSLRRSSPSRSSSHRRYRKDNKDSAGRTRHRPHSGERRSHSGERRSHSGESRDRSRSPGSSRSRRSHSSGGSSRSEAKHLNKQQAILPIFADPKKKSKSSMV